ncbi:LamG-like jellyroll fold domain-containing protein, partial [Microbacterium panaciterrae]|uniref:LamG-like jellyroll fold domain-containing protein n=1 Tax=Microbacterium panaciterrae TaxID=985759 RepID=UPI0031E78B9F
GATDVAGYEYWISRSGATSPTAAAPVPVSLTSALPACPTQQGTATFACASTTTLTVAPIDDTSVLWVASYDTAGNISPATPLPLTGNGGTPAALAGTASFHSWPMKTLTSPYPSVIPDSNISTATDTTGRKNLTVGTGTTWTTGTIQTTTNVPMLSFTGTASPATTVSTPAGSAGAGIDTTKSFTASAWVKPATSTGTLTIMAQSGTTQSGFLLEDVAGTIRFCIQPQTGTTGPDCAIAPNASPAGTWVMATGIWDAVNHQIRIILNNMT